jgi:hypothetical protein
MITASKRCGIALCADPVEQLGGSSASLLKPTPIKPGGARDKKPYVKNPFMILLSVFG